MQLLNNVKTVEKSKPLYSISGTRQPHFLGFQHTSYTYADWYVLLETNLFKEIFRQMATGAPFETTRELADSTLRLIEHGCLGKDFILRNRRLGGLVRQEIGGNLRGQILRNMSKFEKEVD